MMSPLLAVLLIEFVAWSLCLAVALWVAWKPWRTAQGSWGRLFGAAAYIAALAVLPLLVWAIPAAAGDGRSSMESGPAVTPIVSILALVFGLPYLQAPIRLTGSKDELPIISDPAFLERLKQLATRMRVPVPLARVWPTLMSSQQTLAFVGTLQAPQIIVTDGILHRLEEDERDSIVAHELGHLANGSLWVYAAELPVAFTAFAVASNFLPYQVALGWSFLFYAGLKRIISRPFELDCDRRAARAIGWRTTISAMQKLHVVADLHRSNLLPLVAHALSTHPHLSVRLTALDASAPAGDRMNLGINPLVLRRHRIVTTLGLLVWGLLVVGLPVILRGAELSELQGWGIGAATFLVSVTPVCLLLATGRKRAALQNKRMGTKTGVSRVLLFLLVCGALLGGMAFLSSSLATRLFPQGVDIARYFVLLLMFLFITAGALWMLRKQKQESLRQQQLSAMQVHNFARAIELAVAQPKLVAKDHRMRHNLALCHAVCGDRDAAIRQLRQLRKDKPDFPLAGLVLGQLELNARLASEALQTADGLEALLPDDPGRHLLKARALQMLGRLGEAAEVCQRVIESNPATGTAEAVASSIAVELGELPRAETLLEQAMQFAPGDCEVKIVQAEFALAAGTPAEAHVAVEGAAKSSRETPLAFLDSRIARLRECLAGRETGEVATAVALTTDATDGNADSARNVSSPG